VATVVASAFAVGSPRASFAATPPQLNVSASSAQVEVGEPFTIELKATVDQGDPRPNSPELSPPRDLRVVGQSEGTQMMVNQTNAGMSVRVGLQALWQIVADKPGRYTIRGPSVQWNGQKVTGSPVTIEVVAATGRPRRQQQNSPFLMPGAQGWGFSLPFGNMPGAPEPVEAEPQTSPDLAMPVAPDPAIFARTIVDKKAAVVGEQITLSSYIYVRAPQIRSVSNNEAPLSDFLRIPLTPNPGAEPMLYATAGQNRYQVKLIDRFAIFPLRAGDLHTGKYRYDFRDARQTMTRLTEDVVIHVTEPPRAGRPVGYVVGDVGKFTLTSDVQPRRIDQGGEVAVKLVVKGTGYPPLALRIPERTGIEWLDPDRKENIEPQQLVVQGERSFGYVVRIKESGAVDLGEVTLPYWDPAAKQYGIAKAALGKVQVNPMLPAIDPATKQPVEPLPPDPFATLPGARAALGAYVPPARRRFDGNAMWLLIAAPPLLVGAFSLSASAARRAAARRASTKESPSALAQAALADARAAEKTGDAKGLAAALERAVHLAVESATSLKSRGVLLTDLPEELIDRGLPEHLAEEIASTLGACDAVRFLPSAGADTMGDLDARVRKLVAELLRRGRGAAA
jgi:hypothetical protein